MKMNPKSLVRKEDVISILRRSAVNPMVIQEIQNLPSTYSPGSVFADAYGGLQIKDVCEEIFGRYDAQIDPVLLWDGSQCDLVSKSHVYKVCWTYKWMESLGKVMYQSMQLDLQPGLIVVAAGGDEQHILQAQLVAKGFCVKFHVERLEDLRCAANQAQPAAS